MSTHPAYVGICGPGAAEPGLLELARAAGRLCAEQGWVVLTGGLGGVMAAAAEGAAAVGGTVVAMLPGEDRSTASPGHTVAIPTGLGEMRNALLVRSVDAVLAIGGSWGTLSEIALAARTGVPVVTVGPAWRIEPPPPVESPLVEPAETPRIRPCVTVEKAVAALTQAFGG